jgi:hypothetical protein
MKFTDKCKVCIRNGDLEGLKELSKKIPVEKWRVNLDEFAASHSQLEIVEWLHHNNYRMRWLNVAFGAGRSRNRKILELAYRSDPDSDFGFRLLYWAIFSRKQHVLEWSQSLAPPIPLEWSLVTCAIEENNMESLRWLIMNRCPFGKSFRYFGATSRKDLMLELCSEHTQKIQEVERLWRSFGDGGCLDHEEYVEWPPEEVMKDMIEIMNETLFSELISK